MNGCNTIHYTTKHCYVAYALQGREEGDHIDTKHTTYYNI